MFMRSKIFTNSYTNHYVNGEPVFSTDPFQQAVIKTTQEAKRKLEEFKRLEKEDPEKAGEIARQIVEALETGET